MNRIILSLILITFIVGVAGGEAKAQCKQQVVYNCATNNGKAIYLRDFNTKLKRGSSEDEDSGTKWAVVLNQGTHYRFNLCAQDGFENSIELVLFDAKNPEMTKPYAVTKPSNDPKTHNRFDFICQKSGTYYVSIRFMQGVEGKKSCAVGVLSFVGKNK
jgi:hypothetical protein